MHDLTTQDKNFKNAVVQRQWRTAYQYLEQGLVTEIDVLIHEAAGFTLIFWFAYHRQRELVQKLLLPIYID